MYNAGCRKKSTLLDSIYIVGSPDADEIINILFKIAQKFGLDNNRCNTLIGDSTNYMVAALTTIKFFRFAIYFPGPCHLSVLQIRVLFFVYFLFKILFVRNIQKKWGNYNT